MNGDWSQLASLEKCWQQTDKMDFDMTQVVTHSDTEGEDEENEKSAPVAHIKVLNQPSLKKKLYPIHKGDNTVGRHDLCQVSIPVRSLSKKHACIEVRGRSHFIYDMGSRNKTRRGTHYLTPEVRYELRNNDMVVFADVSCIYLVEDSARASDSGSETDPMSDSETVFHTVAVDMYNSVEPTVNRVVEPELIDVAVTSDPNSCDSAASSDILMPTQDFAVMKIKQESQNQKDAVPSNESPVIKNASREAIKFLVVDSDSENEQENLNTKETLHFQNNGNNEDSLDMELLAAPTQICVADSEDDDNKSEILDMVQDYKTTDNSFFVADTQSDDSPKPPITDSEEPTDGKTDRNGSASPTSPFRTSFVGSPRTYSKKDACNKSRPELMPSKSINTAQKDEEKPVEEDCEETQDPNLFALSTLVPDENILRCPTSPDSKSPPASPNSNKNTTLNTTNDETETVTADEKDTLPVSGEGATVPVNSEEAETVPVTNDTATNNTADTQMVSDQETSVAVSDTIPVTSQNAISFLANKDSDNSIILDNKTPLLVSGQDLATVEITTDETMVVALDIDVRDSETVEVDQLQEDSSQQKQSKEDNSGAEPPLKLEEESDMNESKRHPETCTTSTPSKEPSSPFQLLSDIENCTKAQKEPVLKNIATPVKGNPLNADLLSDVSVGIFDVHVSVPLPVTPSAKGKSPKIPMRQSDDEILEATQPYMIDCLDSPPVQKKNVKAKRNLPFDMGITEESDANNEDETQPYMLEDNKQDVESHSRASFRRGADHEISDDEEGVSVKASPKEKSLKNVTSYQESDTLPLLAENESDTDKIVSESEGSQTSRSTAGRNGSKKVQAVKDLKEETVTSLKTGQETQNVELTKTEELQSEEKFLNAPKECSSLVNAKMTETSKLSKILQSKEASPSVSIAQTILGEKQPTRRNSKDSEESGEAAKLKPNKRGRKRKTAEEKESADKVALPAEHVGAEIEVEEEEIGSKTKKTRRSVHFVGISSSDEYSQESTETRSSRSRRKESQETENETVGRKTRGRTSNAREKGKKGTISKKTDVTETEESSSKGRRSRGPPAGRGQRSEKKAVSQEKALSPPPQKSSNVSSDSFESSESMDLAKQEPKTPTARKRNQSSQSSSQSSPFTTPKRQQLNSSLSPNTPSSRSLSSGSKPKVMFTGVTDDKLQKIVTDLGGSVVTGFDSCTHLVTDKIRRTVKFLCCLARGIPIVSPSWLANCKTAKMFTDHTTHLVSDSNTEKQYKFSLKNSLQHARTGPLLENYKIHVTKSVKPNVDQMKEIMDSCKAQFLKRMPSEEAENTIVISCEEDRTLCQPALDAGIPIVNAEFILTGILQYSISVSKYQIFDSSSGSKRKLVATDKGNAKRRRR
ncbi:MDC1 [Acanthosepion pharaonis]|uniref:Mediator of DNA damage checkpoint protein 1 n=1 Tax=Acanthosepion pharaonis TaxID=158019 RepID=A0A812BRZ4_ACAPH|nr:MDC1 [Sepia pharaonis]